jgi:hypothetical protein
MAVFFDALRSLDVGRQQWLTPQRPLSGTWRSGRSSSGTGSASCSTAVFGTAQEMLALVGAAKGVFPVPAQAPRYYSRPDIVFVPIHDAPPPDSQPSQP